VEYARTKKVVRLKMTDCDKKERLIIVQGDFTGYGDVDWLRINPTSEVWDLSTMKATFELNGIVKTFDDLTQPFAINYDAEQTATMPLGDIEGILRFFNADNKPVTIDNLIPVTVVKYVHGDAVRTSNFELNIEVKQGDEVVMNIGVEAGVSVEVGTTTTLPAGSNATVTNSGSANHLVLDFEIPRGDKGDEGPQGPEGPAGKDGEDGKDGKDGKDAKINGVNTLTLNTTYGISLSQSGNTATISGKEITDVVDSISSLIPAQASEQNQLADKNFVNSSVQTATANFRGNWANWEDVPTNVNDYPEDYAQSKTPTVNDYLVVQDASDYTGETIEGTWRFKYSGTWSVNGKNGWHPEYQVNETPLTAAQLAALNSGITVEGVSQITTNENAIGNLSTLSTSSKTDLVSAINEVNSTASSKVSDVTVDGTSVVTDGVAVIPNASGSNYGVVKLTNSLVSISNTLAATPSAINILYRDIITGVATYDSTSTYAVGDKVRSSSGYYECIVAITNPHAWNASEWQQITIQDEIDGKIGYGTSTTAAATVQKEVTISTIKTLKVGQLIIVTPTETSTVANSTIKLNDFPAYPMLYDGVAITTTTDSYVWRANVPSWWLFDGSNWIFAGHGYDINTTYSTVTVANIIAGTETTGRLVRSDYLKNGIFGVVTAYSSGGTITPDDKYLYTSTADISALTIVAPSSPDVRYMAQINMSSGSTATTLTYPSTFKVLEGCDDVQYIAGVRTFVPVASKRYQIFIENDGVNTVLFAKGI